jgi:hypothetical protein
MSHRGEGVGVLNLAVSLTPGPFWHSWIWACINVSRHYCPFNCLGWGFNFGELGKQAMLPVICRCCGGIISSRAFTENANICADCERIDLEEWPRAVISDAPLPEQVTASQVPAELESFLEIDGPSVVEFTNAVQQAQQAIAEVRAQEREDKERADRSESIRATPQVRAIRSSDPRTARQA